MEFLHKNLAAGRWYKLSFAEQMGNIGSEVSRAIYRQQIGDEEDMKKSAWRALDLMDLTISDRRWQFRLFEPLRLREVFCDLFFGNNNYNTSPNLLKNYFLFFALAARYNQ